MIPRRRHSSRASAQRSLSLASGIKTRFAGESFRAFGWDTVTSNSWCWCSRAKFVILVPGDLHHTMSPELVAPSPRQSESTGARPLPTLLVAAGFTALVFALRSSTFFHSAENWDESLYLLMSRSLLHGH